MTLVPSVYAVCCTFIPSLPRSPDQLAQWLLNAPAFRVVNLLWRLEEVRGLSPGTETALGSLRMFINQVIDGREDAAKIHIWCDSGEEPPEFVWKDEDDFDTASDELPAVVNKGVSQPPARRGFAEHVRREVAIRRSMVNPARFPAPRDSCVVKAPPLFVETCGSMELFSMAEAEAMYRAADQQSNRETRDYLRMRLEALVASGNRRALAPAPSVEQVADLRRRFPNAAEVVDVIERSAALSRLSPNQAFEMPPMLILGEPGVGKTAIAQALARILDTSFLRIDIGTLSSGSQLFGTSLSWSTGGTGQIFNLLAASRCANPMAFLDELDKAQGNSNAPVIPPLLSLLEQETSRSFRDEAIQLALNASQVIWVATANDHRLLSSPLLSRFTVVEMWRPEGEASLTVAREVYLAILRRERWGKAFPLELDQAVLQRLAEWTPREMVRWVKLACGEAARCGRCFIQPGDIPEPSRQERRRPGFV